MPNPNVYWLYQVMQGLRRSMLTAGEWGKADPWGCGQAHLSYTVEGAARRILLSLTDPNTMRDLDLYMANLMTVEDLD